MHISTQRNGDTLTIHLTGRMAFADHGLFRPVLSHIADSGARQVIFDVAELTSVDSAGLGMFMLALEAAQKADCSMTVRNPVGQVKQLLQLARIDKLVQVVAA